MCIIYAHWSASEWDESQTTVGKSLKKDLSAKN